MHDAMHEPSNWLSCRAESPMKPPQPVANGNSARFENGVAETEINWKDRLILRRYHFPAAGSSDHDLATRIDYGGAGYYFPLGTPDADAAAARAAEIYRTVEEQGWH